MGPFLKMIGEEWKGSVALATAVLIGVALSGFFDIPARVSGLEMEVDSSHQEYDHRIEFLESGLERLICIIESERVAQSTLQCR